MPEHGHAHHGPPDTSRGFEQSDLNITSIGKGVLFYFIFTGAIGVVVFLGFLFFHQAEVPPQALSTIPSAPYPVLQNNITAQTDIWNLRAQEDFLLNNTTYVDSSKKTVRVPVDQVIDQLGKSDDPSVLNIAPAPAAAVGAQQSSEPATGENNSPSGGDTAVRPTSSEPVKKRRAPMPTPLQGSLKGEIGSPPSGEPQNVKVVPSKGGAQ
ncbi:MAG TPA: hypothetical protein VGL56_16940 [Fimbriimonadaceae bacterium]|jgi:hypothetical protein